MKMDRTLIERTDPGSAGAGARRQGAGGGGGGGGTDRQPAHHRAQPSFDSEADSSAGAGDSDSGTRGAGNASPRAPSHQGQNQAAAAAAGQTPDGSFRRLSDFCLEDPAVYTQREIKEVLDMINDGNAPEAAAGPHRAGGGGRRDGSGGRGPPRPGPDGPAPHPRARGHGLKPICRAYGILGFVRFLDCYYLTLITRRAKVGSIGGNSIYTIKSTETFPLKPAERDKGPDGTDDGADPTGVLLSMWNRGKRSVGLGLTNREIAELRYQGLYQVVDLTKNFFFSYTYDLTRSLQENFLAMTSRPWPPAPYKDMYAWNHFLTRELEECGPGWRDGSAADGSGGAAAPGSAHHWVLPVVHGAFIQRKLHDYGRALNLVLLARRSRHFAGTRYLKRGVSDRGKVANDVEHEQVIHDETTGDGGVFSSYLQIRGSIPTFWTQESSVTMPKPPIVLNRVDPTYQATQAHFDDLLRRYGSPIIVVDLVKQSEKREREVIVGNEFRCVFVSKILPRRMCAGLLALFLLERPKPLPASPFGNSTERQERHRLHQLPHRRPPQDTLLRPRLQPHQQAPQPQRLEQPQRRGDLERQPDRVLLQRSQVEDRRGGGHRAVRRRGVVLVVRGGRGGRRGHGGPVEEARRSALLPDGADGHTPHELHRVSFLQRCFFVVAGSVTRRRTFSHSKTIHAPSPLPAASTGRTSPSSAQASRHSASS